VISEGGDVRTAWLNLDKVVKGAFTDDARLSTYYALASAAMHGRRGRGRDIVLDAQTLTMGAQFDGLLILERLCYHDEEMYYLARALSQFVRLSHAAGFGGTAAAITDVMAQQAFGRLDRVLVPGTDYTGDGTAESPFRFGSHLQLHQASRAFLEQVGIDVANCPRVLDRSVAGFLCDHWKTPARDYWFQINSLASET
jgi:hypothetical protein